MSPVELRRQIGQLLIGSFEGRTLPPELRSVAREFDLGGVILFARNVENPEQVAGLAVDTQELARDLPLWFSVDQEGGRVARFRRPFTEWPPMAALGRSGDERLTRRFGQALAAELGAVGISLDFAPVLDVLTNPKNPAIGDRALADRADVVARLGSIIITALQEAGVAACGKHFPGHGDTSTDSHHELPMVEHSPDRLRAVEFVPFRAAIDAGVAAIITAHVLVPALDDQNPASLSRIVITEVLRRELDYDGLILTDDMEMGAITNTYDLGDACVQAVAAGCDGVLVCRGNVEKQVRVLEALIHAVEDQRLAMTRIDEALKRHRRAKERFLSSYRPPMTRGAMSIVGSDSHQAIAAEMARFL